ncbi:MAG TPA: ABC transporter ATP-binding protein [Terracidiphilus sp.]|jgi:ABC-type glutathione transport system ATPase component|nr:ABC transporter ATP-binding protein [Terracidiphilus sp.]
MSCRPILQIRLDAAYRLRPILRDVAFEIAPGEILALVGESGAGKSTLVLSVMGLLGLRGGSAKGQVILDGQDLISMPERDLRKIRGRKIALVPQSPMSALNPAISLGAHFREAWKAHERFSTPAFEHRVRTLLGEVQLPSDKEFLSRRPREISVGQAQRVLIAMAMLHRPALIVADEPTSALDPVTQVQVIDLLRTLSRRYGTSMLYISHDLVSVLRLADRIAVLEGGRIVECLPKKDLKRAREEATLAFIRCLPAPPDVLLQWQQDSADTPPAETHYPAASGRQ